MITKAINKNYAGQIAGLFCEGAGLTGLCKANVKLRIIQNFTDQIFEDDFLTGLDTAIYRSITGTFKFSSPGYVKFVANGKDIVTGKTKQMVIDGIPGTKINNWVWIVQHLNDYYQSVGAGHLKAYHLGVVNNKLIWKIDGVDSPYGIIFIPETVGGNGGTGGNGGSTGGGGGIFIKPPAEEHDPVFIPGEVPKPAFDMQKLLIPIAVGLALTFLT